MRLFDWAVTLTIFVGFLVYHLEDVARRDREQIMYDQIDILGRVVIKIADNQYMHLANLEKRVSELENR